MSECRDCGKDLTASERHYYEYRCEKCEGFDLERHEKWLAGGSDPYLDRIYGSAVSNGQR